MTKVFLHNFNPIDPTFKILFSYFAEGLYLIVVGNHLPKRVNAYFLCALDVNQNNEILTVSGGTVKEGIASMREDLDLKEMLEASFALQRGWWWVLRMYC